MNEIIFIGAIVGYFALATVFYGLLARIGFYQHDDNEKAFWLWLFWPIIFVFGLIIVGGEILWEISSGDKS
jgi:hypothetical protein